MSKFINEIKSTLKDCKNSIKDYELSNEGGDYINQGWIEALEYTLGVIDRKVAEESLTRDVAIKRCIDKLKKEK